MSIQRREAGAWVDAAAAIRVGGVWVPFSGPESLPVLPPGETQTLSFTEDTTTDFPNPERGWYVEGKYFGQAFGTKVHPQPIAGVVSENRPTLELYFVNLRDFLYTDTISSAFLNAMNAAYLEARASGVKVVVRHAYNRDDKLVPLDVPIARMKAHIDQLAPYWSTYQDVIATMQGGFMGPWGEQWWSSNPNYLRLSNLNTPALQLELFDYMLANTPSTMMVQWRYVDESSWGMARYPSGANYANRFDGTAIQRAAHYNDSFANGFTMATYFESGAYTTAQEMAYVASIGPHVVMGGEGSQDIGDPTGPFSDGDYIIPIMESWSWDYLNSEYPSLINNKWADTGYLPEISRRLGYRLALQGATLPTHVSVGGALSVSLTIKNAGFGKVYNARPIDLVFVGSNGAFTVRLTSDARRDLPLGGETKTLAYAVTTPSGLVSGQSYAVHLRLPDPSSNLASNNGYAMRLANPGAWSASTGRNSLGATVVAT